MDNWVPVNVAQAERVLRFLRFVFAFGTLIVAGSTPLLPMILLPEERIYIAIVAVAGILLAHKTWLCHRHLRACRSGAQLTLNGHYLHSPGLRPLRLDSGAISRLLDPHVPKATLRSRSN